MNTPELEDIRTFVDQLYRTQSRRVFATLIRLLGDFDLAEEAMHDAFAAAVESWTTDKIPENPRAWLVSTGRFKAIDALRRRARFDHSLDTIAKRLDQSSTDTSSQNAEGVTDDQLRLIFTCCHPALAPETQVALTLREVCGLQTEEIARAFLSAPSTIAQRIVRGKAKIRDAGIPYEVPVRKDIQERLDSVLSVIYLVYNEGYSASSGSMLTRADLSEEAIRLGRLLVELLPDPESLGLLSLMLLQESRRAARISSNGDLILLEDQDRSLWNQNLIQEGISLVASSLMQSNYGIYTVQAAIAAEHARARTPTETNWSRITQCYDTLLENNSSPVVALNRAVALAMRDGPQTGLDLIDELFRENKLADYHLAHAARADMCRRLGQTALARDSYQRALDLAQQEPERRFLQRRLAELE